MRKELENREFKYAKSVDRQRRQQTRGGARMHVPCALSAARACPCRQRRARVQTASCARALFVARVVSEEKLKTFAQVGLSNRPWLRKGI